MKGEVLTFFLSGDEVIWTSNEEMASDTHQGTYSKANKSKIIFVVLCHGFSDCFCGYIYLTLLKCSRVTHWGNKLQPEKRYRATIYVVFYRLWKNTWTNGSALIFLYSYPPHLLFKKFLLGCCGWLSEIEIFHPQFHSLFFTATNDKPN